MTTHVECKATTRRHRSGSGAHVHLAAAFAVVALIGPSAAAAQDPPPFARSSTLKVKTWTDQHPAVTLEYPAKDWQVSGHGLASLVTLEHKTGDAAAVLEYQVRERPTPARLVNDTFVAIEQDLIRTADPQVKDINGRILTVGERRIVMLDFTRSWSSRTERVRVYVIPLERQVFRLVCWALPETFGRYEPVFSHIAASFAGSPTP